LNSLSGQLIFHQSENKIKFA